VWIFLTQLAIKPLFKFPPHPMSASALPGEIWPSKIRVEMNGKTSINSIYPDLWSPRASTLEGMTVMCLPDDVQKCLCEFKKQLVKSGLVWSRTLSTLQSMNRESISVPVFAQWANISINSIAGSWKTKLVEVSAKVAKMWTKCIFALYFDK